MDYMKLPFSLWHSNQLGLRRRLLTYPGSLNEDVQKDPSQLKMDMERQHY